nr:hypothetical protein [uncultured Cetobacterium sp.]
MRYKENEVVEGVTTEIGTLENPWANFEKNHKVGDVISVKIKTLCFAELMGALLLNIPTEDIFAKGKTDEELEVFIKLPNMTNVEKGELIEKYVDAKIEEINVKKRLIILSTI